MPLTSSKKIDQRSGAKSDLRTEQVTPKHIDFDTVELEVAEAETEEAEDVVGWVCKSSEKPVDDPAEYAERVKGTDEVKEKASCRLPSASKFAPKARTMFFVTSNADVLKNVKGGTLLSDGRVVFCGYRASGCKSHDAFSSLTKSGAIQEYKAEERKPERREQLEAIQEDLGDAEDDDGAWGGAKHEPRELLDGEGSEGPAEVQPGDELRGMSSTASGRLAPHRPPSAGKRFTPPEQYTSRLRPLMITMRDELADGTYVDMGGIPKTYQQAGIGVPMLVAHSNPSEFKGKLFCQVGTGATVFTSEFGLPEQMILDVSRDLESRLETGLETWRPKCLVISTHASSAGFLDASTVKFPSFLNGPTKLLQVNACGSLEFISALLKTPSTWLVLMLWEGKLDAAAAELFTAGFWRSFLCDSDLATAIQSGMERIPERQRENREKFRMFARCDIGLHATWDSVMAPAPAEGNAPKQIFPPSGMDGVGKVPAVSTESAAERKIIKGTKCEKHGCKKRTICSVCRLCDTNNFKHCTC